jgi:sugar lactone lactonase YvrE
VVVWGDLGPLRRIFGSKEQQQQGSFIFTGGGAFVSGGGGPFLGSVPNVGNPVNSGNVGHTTPQALPPTRVAVGPTGALYIAPRFATPARQPDSARAKQDLFAALERLRDPKAVAIYNQAESSDTVPQRMIGGSRSSIAEIRDMAVGQDGALYVLGRIRGPQRDQTGIAIFAPSADGDVEPARVIAGPCTRMNNPVAIAVDRKNRVYVASNFGSDDPIQDAASVTVYAPDASGDAAPIRLIVGPRTRLLAPTALAAGDDGTVYVANGGTWNDDNGSVRVYAAGASGSAPPLRTIIGIQTRLVAPTDLVVGRGDTLYVLGLSQARFGKSRITVFAPTAVDDALPIRMIEGGSTGLAGPTALALDASGRLYAANNKEAKGLNAYGPDLGSVTVYRPGADGNMPPERTIEGSYTRLNGPTGIARDKAGNLYVANQWGTGPGSVTVYDPGAEEDVRPIRMIAGPTTGLQAPAGVALDAHDTLYVVNQHTVTVYAPGVTGDATPVRTIGGS